MSDLPVQSDDDAQRLRRLRSRFHISRSPARPGPWLATSLTSTRRNRSRHRFHGSSVYVAKPDQADFASSSEVPPLRRDVQRTLNEMEASIRSGVHVKVSVHEECSFPNSPPVPLSRLRMTTVPHAPLDNEGVPCMRRSLCDETRGRMDVALPNAVLGSSQRNPLAGADRHALRHRCGSNTPPGAANGAGGDQGRATSTAVSWSLNHSAASLMMMASPVVIMTRMFPLSVTVKDLTWKALIQTDVSLCIVARIIMSS